MKRIIIIMLAVMFVFNLNSFEKSFNGVSLNEIAQFLAGKSLPSKSVLISKTRSNKYRWFKRKMKNYWYRYNKNVVKPIKNWRKKWLQNENYKTCFYPFAGADFINAYNFYPKAKEYILIGLEKGGRIPDLIRMSRRRLNEGLNNLVRGYRVFINYNFYRTLGMAVYMDKSPLVGTVTHILVQMAWLGLKPVAAYKVGIGDDLVYSPLYNNRYCSKIAIDFIDKNGIKKRLIYLQLDLRNSSLRKKVSWRRYLNNLGPVSGIYKAATYLTPRYYYSIIRNISLKNMQTIVQDDSGIPYRYLKYKWNITLFGKYKRPHVIFPSYGQPQLKRAYRNRKYRRLNFNFSYDRPNKWRNMMLAIKKK